jgi:hypothetical protein
MVNVPFNGAWRNAEFASDLLGRHASCHQYQYFSLSLSDVIHENAPLDQCLL